MDEKKIREQLEKTLASDSTNYSEILKIKTY